MHRLCMIVHLVIAYMYMYRKYTGARDNGLTPRGQALPRAQLAYFREPWVATLSPIFSMLRRGCTAALMMPPSPPGALQVGRRLQLRGEARVGLRGRGPQHRRALRRQGVSKNHIK
jgi:hypothetical protein